MTERERALLQGKKISPLTKNESAIAYAVAHGGGSEPTYETLATVLLDQEGEMPIQLPEGFGTAAGEVSEETHGQIEIAINNGTKVFYLDETIPLTFDETTGVFVNNIEIVDGESFRRLDDTKPAYMIGMAEHDDGAEVMLASTEDYRNKTITLSVEEEKSVESPVTILRASLSDFGGANGPTGTMISTDEEVAAAFAGDKPVVLFASGNSDTAGQSAIAFILYGYTKEVEGSVFQAFHGSAATSISAESTPRYFSTIDVVLQRVTGSGGSPTVTLDFMSHQYNTCPAYDDHADEGKVLMIHNNQMEWVMPT